MRTIQLTLLCVALLSGITIADCGTPTASCSGMPTSASCSGSVVRQPVRNVLSKIATAQPVRTVVKKVASVQPVRTLFQRTATYEPTSCDSVENTTVLSTPTVTSDCPCSSPVLTSATDSSSYARALASAQYRAANGIKGHVRGELLMNRASSAGVGFSTNNPNPRTCLGVPGQTSATCAVVKGRDGWYSTCVRP